MNTPPRVLIVDDEALSRELCQDFLEEGGYELAAAADGQAALELLKSQSFDLVLSDINMPRMDGLQLLKSIKAADAGVEVILMTAFGGLQSAVEALRFGAYDYITKPFPKDHLLATVRRCLEKQRLARELRETQEELIKKEKLATLGAMAGWLAHRLRNPLNVILMCSQYLGTKFDEGDERRDVMRVIQEKVDILEKLIRDFIEYSRTYQPRCSPEDLNALLDQSVSNIESRSRLQKVEIRKSFEDLPAVPLDRDLMEEVLGNLLDNALEAIGGPGTITLRTARAGDAAMIEISNSGTPIAAETAEKVFEPFFTTKERGTGLGLAIAHRVVESHGGTITVRADPETTFRIELPLVAPAVAAAS
jgi:signal transduction histidine kinase